MISWCKVYLSWILWTVDPETGLSVDGWQLTNTVARKAGNLMSSSEEQAVAKAVETLIEHGWRWGDSALGESPKSLVPSFRKIEPGSCLI